MTERLISVTDWVLDQENTKNTTLWYFGASTGDAAALIAADNRQLDISVIVSGGGRVDLSFKYTSKKNINCPTLFIVGEKDQPVIKWTRRVLDTYLEKIAKKASGWFRCYFQIKEHMNE